MKIEQVIDRIQTGRIIAILRGDFGGREEEMAAALCEAGITAVEVTMNSPRALESIKRLASRFGSSMAVGAGTVLTPYDVACAAGAGAQFIVSPNREARVIGGNQTPWLGLVSRLFHPFGDCRGLGSRR